MRGGATYEVSKFEWAEPVRVEKEEACGVGLRFKNDLFSTEVIST